MVEKVKCPLCEVAHKTEWKFRQCIVTHEFYDWLDYSCNNPRNAGIGTTNNAERFTNHLDLDWYWSSIRDRVRYRDDNRCNSCGSKVYDGEVHHVRPKSKGGMNNPDNLIYLCQHCHKSHTKKLVQKKQRGGEVLLPPRPVQQMRMEDLDG